MKISKSGVPKPFPNPPKIHPKSRSNKTYDLHRFWDRFFMFCLLANIEILCAQPVFCKEFRFLVVSDMASFLGPKNLSKTSPKPFRNHDKIESENKLFFNVHFSGFRPRFWRALRPQMDAKFAIFAVLGLSNKKNKIWEDF